MKNATMNLLESLGYFYTVEGYTITIDAPYYESLAPDLKEFLNDTVLEVEHYGDCDIFGIEPDTTLIVCYDMDLL